MTEFTRERLKEIVNAAGGEPCDYEEVFDSIKTGEIVSMARQLLASMEAPRAEPSYWLSVHKYQSYLKFNRKDAERDAAENGGLKIIPLYTAPPAPVSVPVVPEWAWSQKIKVDGLTPHQAHAKGWNDLRAVMLKGAESAKEITGNSPVIPERD